MCTGAEPYLLAASLAATAGGTAMQIRSNKKKERASNDAALRDLERKKDTSNKANAIFNAEMENSDVGDASADADKAAEQQLLETRELINRSQQDTGFTSPTETPGLDRGSPVVKEVAARTLADELAKTEGQLKSAATLQGLAQRQRNRAIQFGRAGEQMSLLGNFNQGWNQVADVEQRMAQFAGSKDAMLGDVLTGLGAMGTAYSGAKGYGFGSGSGAAGGSTLAGSANPYGTTSTMATVGNSGATYGKVPYQMGGYFSR